MSDKTIVAVDNFDVSVEAQAYVGGKVCNVVLGGSIGFSLIHSGQQSRDGGKVLLHVEVDLSRDEIGQLHRIMHAAAERAIAGVGKAAVAVGESAKKDVRP